MTAENAGIELPPIPETPGPTTPDPTVTAAPVPAALVHRAELAVAVQSSLEKFAREHPLTYKAICSRVEDPIALVVESLERDEVYRALVARTEDATQLAAIISSLLPVVLSLVQKFLIPV